MIDTIRLRIRVENIDPDKVIALTCTRKGTIQYKVFKETISIPSSSYDLNIFINSQNLLTLEFSIPKYLYGNNIKEAQFTDILPVLKEIQTSLNEFCTTEEITLWEIMRIDLCKYQSSSQPYHDIFFYKNLLVPRKQKRVYDTSVMFTGTTQTMKVYLKHDEFLKNDFRKIIYTNENKALELSEESRNLIRFEIGYRKKALQNIFKTDRIIDIYYLLENKKTLMNYHNKQLKKLNAHIPPDKLHQKNLLEELKKNYKPRRALQLYQFYIFYISNDENKLLTSEMYSKSQINRNLKAVRDVFIF